jgi:hypothetical protein
MAKKRRTTQSANKKEFNRIRRNILQRMRYREKQGFKVDYSTKPANVKNPTKRDIEKLKKYDVGLNQFGEVVSTRSRRGVRTTKAITKEDVVQAKEFIQNDSDYVSRETSVGQKRTSNIDDIKANIRGIAKTRGSSEFYEYNDVAYADSMSSVFNLVADLLLMRIDKEIAIHGEEAVDEYYGQRMSEISNALADMGDSYYEDEVMSMGADLEQLLIVP